MYEKPKSIYEDHSIPGRQERVEAPCRLCGEMHSISECPKLVALSRLKEEERGTLMSKIENVINKSGVSEFENRGIQTLLAQLASSPEEQLRIMEKIVTHYRLGQFEDKKDSSGRQQRIFRSRIIVVNPRDERPVKIKLDEKPIGFDRDSNEYVLRERRIMPGGALNQGIEIGAITALDRLDYEVEERNK